MNNTFLLQSKNNSPIKRHDTGIILHLYYPEMWDEILSYLHNLGKEFDLFVTIPYQVDFSENLITTYYPDANIYRCENRGRDVAPFLAIYSLVSNLGYKYLCKIHTKRDTQIGSAVSWRQDMLQKLLGSPQMVQAIKTAFDQHIDWGMVAPEGHVVPYNYFWSNNAARVTELAHSIGVSTDNLEFSYVAGTMFWFRPEALHLIHKANLDFRDFVSEQGQQDATLAHVLERFFGLATIYGGYKIAESNSYGVRPANVGLHLQALAGWYEELQQVNQALRDRIQHIEKINLHSLEEENQNLKLLISAIYTSSSWRITQPIRDVKTIAQKLLGRTRPSSSMQLAKTPSLPADQKQTNIVQAQSTTVENQEADTPKNLFLAARVVDRKKISVIITSYNHERYIKQCMDSILDQEGNFNLEIILGDDCSTDKTPEILQQYCEKYPAIIRMMPEQENMGVTKNLKRCLDACQGDFIAICEGDDYWTDEFKLQKQMECLEAHKDYSMCFSAFMIFYEDRNEISPFNEQVSLQKDVITTEDLIRINYIGNFSCCMYRSESVRRLPGEIFEVFTVDWMFNMACGEIGGIGFIRDTMSVYRKHSDGLWAGKPVALQQKQLITLIDVYDELLSKRYHAQFENLKSSINAVYLQNDLLILDTVFPHPLSPFRFQEFTSYFDYFLKSKVLTTGEHLLALNESRNIQEVIEEFEEEYPEYKGRTIATSHNIGPYHGRLAYTVFFNNMKVFLESLERQQIPFIFTLYPGGGFELDKSECDEILVKIFNSPQFRKVIVTQKLTLEYLINKKLCHPDKIEFIFGVVTPLELLKPYEGKRHFGFEKETLDICFVAHKYMPRGIDKGYDVFIEVASKLTKIHENIYFHVVGNFSEEDIPIHGLGEKIKFYGLQKKEWFNNFYRDKDIILSPNIPFTLAAANKAFDGFPTASCTEAGLRNVAILCTDPLELNISFTDGQEIVIIPHDSEAIVNRINDLYSNPEKLREIAENGSTKIREIYSYENQLSPRIKILEEMLKEESLKSPTIDGGKL